MKSKVYFTDFRTYDRENLQQKLSRLILTAGMDQIDFKGKFVAVKIHFGEKGNLAFLRPNFAYTVVDLIKQLGGIPFLTDCNTLYRGSRKNAPEHIETAYQNGFNPYNTGCHILIADGLRGDDDVEVPLEGCDYVTEAKIGRSIMDADIIVSLTHVKAHEDAGLGGTMKNIGMGSGSRRGKREMHSASKPAVIRDKCVGCGSCAKICAHDAPHVVDGKAEIDLSKCLGCARCVGVCPVGALEFMNADSEIILCRKIAEYTKAVVQGRPQFHISLAMDISPYCDCHGNNDAPIIPDVGMFASFDPVAIDAAAGDMCNEMLPLMNSRLGENRPDCPDRFTGTHTNTDWRQQIRHAEKIGLGSGDYELIRI